MRARGVRVGFIGLAAQKLPQLFADTPTSSSTANPKRRLMRLMDGETLTGIVAEPEIDDLDRCRFRPGNRWLATAPLRVPFAGRPVGGSLPVLASAQLPRVLHLLPASDPVEVSVALGRQHPRRAVVISHDTRGPRARRLSRSAVLAGSRPRARALRRHSARAGLTHTFECETRLDRLDAELLTTMHAAGPARHELRRRGGVAGHAEEGRAAADSRSSTSARSSRDAASSASSRRRSTCSGFSTRHLGVDQRDDRLLGRARLDGRAVQDPDAVSRDAALQADERR